MSSVAQDLRYAARKLARSPGFTFVAVLTLALGIGATTAIFSVVHAVLLRTPAYPEPGQLVVAAELTAKGEEMPVAGLNFQDWRSRARSFQGMAAYSGGQATVLGGSEPVRPEVTAVSTDFFGLMRTPPVRGRVFTPDETKPGGPPVAVVSHEFWQNFLGGATDLSARPLEVFGTSYSVVGVMPPGFRFPGKTAVWTPETLADPGARSGHNWNVVGRLKPGVGVETAHGELNAIQRALRAEHGKDVDGEAVQLMTLQESLAGNARRPLLLLLGASALVLLIACANLASTLLARGAARRQEMAVRAALGAGRGRLTRQLFTEGLLLAAVGAVAGVGVAVVLVRVLASLSPAGALAGLEGVRLNGPVLAFALLAAVFAAVLFGLVPALRTSGTDMGRELAGTRAVAARGRGAPWNLLVGAEVALSLLLLVGAGLLIRSFLEVSRVELGYETSGVLTADLALPETAYPDTADVAAFHQAFLAELTTVPGVRHAGIVNLLPLSGGNINGGFDIEGREPGTGYADYRVASAGYFHAMGIPLVRGRLFDPERDRPGTPDVGIINRALAEKLWPGQDPVGQRIRNLANDSWVYGDRWITIVGVVGDVRHWGPLGEPAAEVYVHYAQRPFRARYATLAVSSTVPPASLIATVRSRLSARAPQVPAEFRTMEDRAAEAVGTRRFTMAMLTLFAGLALFLAAVGIYGVISYQVVQRTRELGIRLALGATEGAVRSMVIRGSMAVVAAGLAVGAVGAYLLTSTVRGLLFGVEATDPATFAVVVLLLAAVGLAASYLPARRATRVDPMIALRSE